MTSPQALGLIKVRKNYTFLTLFIDDFTISKVTEERPPDGKHLNLNIEVNRIRGSLEFSEGVSQRTQVVQLLSLH